MSDIVSQSTMSPRFDNTYVGLPDRFYARQNPTPVKNPSLIALNEPLADELGLIVEWLKSPAGLSMLAGNVMPETAEPLSMAYAGHQFGNWVPQLGDGRAVLLGELVRGDGIRFDVQLKGSGPTPFSRNGDGRAWIGPIIREYVVSEAMNALGIPTTRALAAVTSGETVVREAPLPGGLIARVARSHIRVGTFQYLAARRDEEGLRALADFAIDRLYPDIAGQPDRYVALLKSVATAQAKLIAHWMSVGFIHGVMNTDNMAISGETIDYGPCAFMDEFHPDKVFSSIDEMGRYAYSNQPRVGQWNLVCFAQCLLPLIDEDEQGAIAKAQEFVDAFPSLYQREYDQLFAEKLGFASPCEPSRQLVQDLLLVMATQQCDFTNTFRALSKLLPIADERDDIFLRQFTDDAGIADWLQRWRVLIMERSTASDDPQSRMMHRSPAIVPRNHQIEKVIQSALDTGTFAEFHALNSALATPYLDSGDGSEFSTQPQENEKVRYTFCGT